MPQAFWFFFMSQKLLLDEKLIDKWSYLRTIILFIRTSFGIHAKLRFWHPSQLQLVWWPILRYTVFNVDFPDRLERTLTGRRDLEQRSPLHRSRPLRLSLSGTSEENIFFVFAHICICNFFVFLPRPLFVTLYSHLYFPFVLMTALIFVCNFNFISCPTYEPWV